MKFPSIATALMAACVALTTPAQAQESFKIGNLSPLSGPAAAFGIGINRGIELAAEDVGTFQVAGKPYKLEVVPYDTSWTRAKPWRL